MSRYLVKKTFKGAINGIYVREFVMGERALIDDPDLARVALDEGLIEALDGEKAAAAAPRSKAAKAAPKNKAAE